MDRAEEFFSVFFSFFSVIFSLQHLVAKCQVVSYTFEPDKSFSSSFSSPFYPPPLILQHRKSNKKRRKRKKMPSNAPTPITILTGFLGSGKTTLLLKLLPQLPTKYGLALLKNEFGDVTVDSRLAAQGSISGVKELLNGWLVFCSGRGCGGRERK
jgi:hypothetical protein